MRRAILLVASIALTVLLADGQPLVSPGGSEVSAQMQQKPNIVYILTDDLDTYTLNQVETTRSLLPLANPLLLPGARSHTPSRDPRYSA